MSTNDHGSARLSDQVAEEILALMGRRRINKAEMARRLGAKADWVGRRLNGHQPIDVEDLQRIAVVLGVNANDLLPKAPGAPTAGDAKKPIDPLAQRVIATIGEPQPGRHATPRRTGRLDNPPRPVRNGRDRRPMAVVAASDRNPRRA